MHRLAGAYSVKRGVVCKVIPVFSDVGLCINSFIWFAAALEISDSLNSFNTFSRWKTQWHQGLIAFDVSGYRIRRRVFRGFAVWMQGLACGFAGASVSGFGGLGRLLIEADGGFGRGARPRLPGGRIPPCPPAGLRPTSPFTCGIRPPGTLGPDTPAHIDRASSAHRWRRGDRASGWAGVFCAGKGGAGALAAASAWAVDTEQNTPARPDAAAPMFARRYFSGAKITIDVSVFGRTTASPAKRNDHFT